MMVVTKFNMYSDGGTVEIVTNRGIFCFDNRIGSKTTGRLYNGYPNDNNSNIVEDSIDLENDLIDALKNYKDAFYQSSIDFFIKEHSS